VAKTSTSVNSTPRPAQTTREAESERYMATIYISRTFTAFRAGFRSCSNLGGWMPGASSRSLARRQAGNDRGSTRVRELSFPAADEASGRLVAPGAARAGPG
jgi:hypothetical protein